MQKIMMFLTLTLLGTACDESDPQLDVQDAAVIPADEVDADVDADAIAAEAAAMYLEMDFDITLPPPDGEPAVCIGNDGSHCHCPGPCIGAKTCGCAVPKK